MNVWHKYKNYITKSLNTNVSEVRIVFDKITNKPFFCLDDLLAYCGYKKDEDGCIDKINIKKYKDRLKVVHFLEIYRTCSFISMDGLKNLSSVVYSVSGSPNKKANSITIVRGAFNAYIRDCKERTELDIPEEFIESFVNIGSKQIAVASHEGQILVQVTDVMRYCGYKDIKIKDNMKEFCVKIQTKKGLVNFMSINSFPLIAKSMANEKYSNKLNILYGHFARINPSSDLSKVIIDKERSVIMYEKNVIDYKLVKDVVYFKTSTIQSMCGYIKDKTLDNFKERSTKIDDIYFMTIQNIKDLLGTKMTPKYKKELNKIYNALHRFA